VVFAFSIGVMQKNGDPKNRGLQLKPQAAHAEQITVSE